MPAPHWIRGGPQSSLATQLYDATVSPIHSLWTACHANSLSGNRKILSAQINTQTQTHPISVNVYQADKYMKEPPPPFPGTSCHLPWTTDRGLGVKWLTDPMTFPPSPPHPGTASGEQQHPESTWEVARTSQFPLQVHVCRSECHLHLTYLLSAWTEPLFAEPARRILKVQRSTQRKPTAQNFPP